MYFYYSFGDKIIDVISKAKNQCTARPLNLEDEMEMDARMESWKNCFGNTSIHFMFIASLCTGQFYRPVRAKVDVKSPASSEMI